MDFKLFLFGAAFFVVVSRPSKIRKFKLSVAYLQNPLEGINKRNAGWLKNKKFNRMIALIVSSNGKQIKLFIWVQESLFKFLPVVALDASFGSVTAKPEL